MEGIARIRSFNRTVTRQIGALDTHFLGRDRSLGASRLLFEIGPQGSEVRHLRSRLELDSGYLSRLLRSLESEGLIRTNAASRDGRVRRVVLTAAGRREFTVLNRLSDAAAESMLEPLSSKQRAALITAMESVERLMLASAVRLTVEDPASPPAQYCLARYFEELAARFDSGFDPSRSISAAVRELTPPLGYFVLATLHGEPIGCGALKCHENHGEIKRMWVDATTRGLGVGKRILDKLERLAREKKLALLRLETNRSLTEAQSLYRSSGYKEVKAFNAEPYAHHWFEKMLQPESR
jgi:DNA-binding MarR family transcriptional regulator/GNAT superfamily N-acetyltransferase